MRPLCATPTCGAHVNTPTAPIGTPQETHGTPRCPPHLQGSWDAHPWHPRVSLTPMGAPPCNPHPTPQDPHGAPVRPYTSLCPTAPSVLPPPSVSRRCPPTPHGTHLCPPHPTGPQEPPLPPPNNPLQDPPHPSVPQHSTCPAPPTVSPPPSPHVWQAWSWAGRAGRAGRRRQRWASPSSRSRSRTRLTRCGASGCWLRPPPPKTPNMCGCCVTPHPQQPPTHGIPPQKNPCVGAL